MLTSRTSFGGDILVVLTLVGFGRRGEQGLWQFLRLDQSLWKWNTMDRAGFLVFSPT